MKSFFKNIQKHKCLTLMLLPAFIILLLFNILPMFGIIIAFKNYKFGSIWAANWVGFKWFIKFFTGPYFVRLFKNTFLLGFWALVINFPATIILALMLNEIKNERFKKLIQTVTYLPYFISVVIVVGILKQFLSLDGIINNLISSLGGEKINFLAQPECYRTIFIGSSMWQGIGWGTIIYLAALSGVDVQLYEAATIDGAGRWKKMLHITLPAIVPTICITFILSVGQILNSDYQKALLLYSPTTLSVADIFGTYTYREGIENGNYSYTTAVGLFTSVVSMVFICLANYVSKKCSDTSMF